MTIECPHLTSAPPVGGGVLPVGGGVLPVGGAVLPVGGRSRHFECTHSCSRHMFPQCPFVRLQTLLARATCFDLA